MTLLIQKSPHSESLLSDDVLKYLIPACVTLFVFGLGLFATWLKLNLERRRQYRQLKALFYTWVPNFSAPVETFAASCADLAKRLAASQRLSAEAFGFLSLNTDKLAAIDIHQLVKAFIYNSTGEEHSNNEQLFYLTSNLDFLHKLGPEIEAKYQEHYAKANSLMTDWNAAFMTLTKQTTALFSDPAAVKSQQRQDLEHQLRINAAAWLLVSAQNPQNTTLIYNNLITPNMIAVNQFFQASPSQDVQVNDLMTAISAISVIYMQWRTSHEGYATVFNNYAGKLRETYGRLQAAVDHFQTNTAIKIICD
ncbi:hypothetical protein ACFGVR_17670 [Mucilaginibacter sp. AW1-3]